MEWDPENTDIEMQRGNKDDAYLFLQKKGVNSFEEFEQFNKNFPYASDAMMKAILSKLYQQAGSQYFS